MSSFRSLTDLGHMHVTITGLRMRLTFTPYDIHRTSKLGASLIIHEWTNYILTCTYLLFIQFSNLFVTFSGWISHSYMYYFIYNVHVALWTASVYAHRAHNSSPSPDKIRTKLSNVMIKMSNSRQILIRMHFPNHHSRYQDSFQMLL